MGVEGRGTVAASALCGFVLLASAMMAHSQEIKPNVKPMPDEPVPLAPLGQLQPTPDLPAPSATAPAQYQLPAPPPPPAAGGATAADLQARLERLEKQNQELVKVLTALQSKLNPL